MRAARMARVGARAGRVLKPFTSMSAAPDGNEDCSHAKLLGEKLSRLLSTKIALLTVVLVLGVPFFSLGVYPIDDFSGSSWTFKLERDYFRAYRMLAKESYNTTDILEITIE